MTPQEFAAKMTEIAAGGDEEISHCDADDLLCQVLSELGYDEGVQIFLAMKKWYA